MPSFPCWLPYQAKDDSAKALVVVPNFLAWIEAKRLDHRRKPQAIDRFLDAAAYAYDYLFEDNPVLAQGRGPTDPRYQLAMGIYNAGVERLIRAAQGGNPQIAFDLPFLIQGGWDNPYLLLDRDALLALRPQTIGEQRKINLPR